VKSARPSSGKNCREHRKKKRHALDYTLDTLLNAKTVTEVWASGTGPYLYDDDYDEVSRLSNAAYPTLLTLPGSEAFPYDDSGNRDDDPDFRLRGPTATPRKALAVPVRPDHRDLCVRPGLPRPIEGFSG
jgi:hypothetical protein